MKKFHKKVSTKKVRIAVIGDAMLDEYYSIVAERISPEYPIPVELSETDDPYLIMPGGAANVAHQMLHCNADINLFYYADSRAFKVFAKFFNTNHVLITQYDIPRKQRYYHDKFPLRRRDIEKPITDPECREDLYTSFKEYLEESPPDAVILSDYNKGIFNYDPPYFSRRIIGLCREYDIPTIVDPKAGPLEQWKGCTTFKLNEKEAKVLSGRDTVKDQLNYLHAALVDETRDHQVIITQGGQSVVGYNEKLYTTNPIWKVAGKNVPEAECVIGAGDCFVAYLAVAQAHGLSVKSATEVAYAAGAAYVRQRHNRPVKPDQLLGFSSKITKAEYLKSRDFKLVFTNGCFDILHSGHIEMLQAAKEHGDKLVVAVDTDDSIKKLKGDDRPINSLVDRMKVLTALECVDFVIAFHTDELYNLIKEIRPDVMVKGGSYKLKEIVGHDLVKKVVRFPMVKGKSTTNVIERLK